jgi:hypothetical protein
VYFSLQEAQVYSFSANHAKGSVILTEHESAYLIIRLFFKKNLNAIGTIFCINKNKYIPFQTVTAVSAIGSSTETLFNKQ